MTTKIGQTGPDDDDGAVAIVGMAGRFPGADDVEQLWALLTAQRTAIRRFERAELFAAGVPARLADDPDYVPFGAPMAGADLFDAEFFGITPAEAALTDPQHRIFLASAWAALEDAGVAVPDPGRRIGVFGGTGMNTYLVNNILSHPDRAAEGMLSYPVMLGNDKDFLCTRTAYRLGLTGPAVTVQTACSTSLVAVHLACQSLLEGECDTALAGGVSILVPQEVGYPYRPGGPLSADGQCRVFDDEGTGTVKGNGCAVVVLRRLADAIEDRDHVYAVIRATAVNNDGSAKVGFTAPSVAGQRAVIQDALAFAGLEAEEIGYVETHGTGTRLGDPIEIRALSEAYAAGGRPPSRCLIGSLKANLGHLDAAAGVAGLVKAALVLDRQTVPGQVGFRAANPELKLETTPFEVPASTLTDRRLQAAGVSSFGMGGTNAHAVLARAPGREREPEPEGPVAVLVSSRDEDALRSTVRRLHDHLAAHPEIRLDDTAFTLLNGRARFASRAGWIVSDRAELLGALSAWLADDAAARGDAGRWGGPAVDGWLAGEEPDPADCGPLEAAVRVPLPGHAMRPVRHWIPRYQKADEAVGRAEDQRGDRAAGAARTGEAAAAATIDDIRDVVLDILRSELGMAGFGPDDDYLDAGGESLSALSVVAAFTARLGVSISLAEFESARTAARMARTLFARGNGEQDRRELIVRLKAGRTGSDVFLVHPAGGTAFAYEALARHSTDLSPLHVVTYAFDEPEEQPTVESLAERYLAEVERVRPAGPYRLGGYSFGGNVAFEMALRLRAAGERVERLVLIDSLPPEAYAGIATDEAAFSAMAPHLMREALGLDAVGFGDAPAPATIREAARLVRRPEWTDAAEAEARSQLHAMLLHIRALAAYQPTLPFDGPTAILAVRDRSPVLGMLGMGNGGAADWAARITGPVRTTAVAGDHYSAMRAHAAELAAAFDAALNEEFTEPAGRGEGMR